MEIFSDISFGNEIIRKIVLNKVNQYLSSGMRDKKKKNVNSGIEKVLLNQDS